MPLPHPEEVPVPLVDDVLQVHGRPFLQKPDRKVLSQPVKAFETFCCDGDEDVS